MAKAHLPLRHPLRSSISKAKAEGFKLRQGRKKQAKKLLVAKGIATSNKEATSSSWPYY